MRCTVVQQGYAPHTVTKDCLAHTGQSLSPFLLFAVAIVAVGVLLRLVTRPGRVRRKNWTREYRAMRDDEERGL